MKQKKARSAQAFLAFFLDLSIVTLEASLRKLEVPQTCKLRAPSLRQAQRPHTTQYPLTHYSLLITHYSLLITHYLLFLLLNLIKLISPHIYSFKTVIAQDIKWDAGGNGRVAGSDGRAVFLQAEIIIGGTKKAGLLIEKAV